MAKRFAIVGLTMLTGLIGTQTYAQRTGVDGRVGAITTAVPFLRISPDARSGAMGDVGIALSPDANAQYWNVAKLAMSPKDMGISVTYTPWLKDLVPDVFMGYLSAYKKFGKESNQAISASLRYFNLGNIDYTTFDAQPAGSGKPREFSFDLGYSIRLSNQLSVGATMRYISSNIAAGAPNEAGAYSPGKAFAVDAGVFYTSTKEMAEDRSGTFSAGAVLSNVGSKISYSQNQRDFLPINLGLGAAYTYKIDAYNKVTAALDLNKALVPAPRYYKDVNGVDSGGYIPNDGVVSGMLGSFTKAPPGYGTTISIGGEYWYQDQFAVRAGYFYENKNNGDRQYFTCGLGVRYSVFGLNFSYLVPSGSGVARNPLSNTLRFSLLFDFDKSFFQKKEG
ncbi:type IX secretion system outer membrane channel protein PorV [Taibaiella helva]|uniref:type IX secretion system outer membrane channel protein PorV n=1 Tax=Taibaiella helva TaxID=2301235 RepID=UPI0013008C11|nr:type IX secretion system outer membrane channel protein PorV [Taibaiella helva]